MKKVLVLFEQEEGCDCDMLDLQVMEVLREPEDESAQACEHGSKVRFATPADLAEGLGLSTDALEGSTFRKDRPGLDRLARELHYIAKTGDLVSCQGTLKTLAVMFDPTLSEASR